MKKLLLLCLVLAGHTLWAQSDEPTATTTILAESTDYKCDNQVSGNFQGFTPSSINTCNGQENYVTLWYRFIPSKSATYALAIEEVGGGEVAINFYSGSPGNLTPSGFGCSTRYTQLDLNANETYYLSITGQFTTTEYSACIFATPETPVNDEPENAIAIQASTYGVCENQLVEQHAIKATNSEEEICSTGNRDDVWFAFTPTETANYTVNYELINNYNPTSVGIYGGEPGNLALISFTDEDILEVGCGPRATADLTANTTYYIAFSIVNTSRVTYFNLCTYKTPAPPVNDNCDNAINLTVGGDFDKSAIVADNTSATRETRHTGPNCEFFFWATPNGNGKDVWFTATIPASGNLIIETRAYSDAEKEFLDDTGMQSFVAGSCDDLEPYRFTDYNSGEENVFCNGVFDYNQLGNNFAGIRFTNKTPGDKVLIRVYPWAHQYGRFKIAAYDDTVLSVNEFDKSVFSYAPNPTTDIINVNYVNNIESVTVRNLLGKTILSETYNSKNIQLDLSSFATGIYIITAKSDKNEVTNFKVVKK